MTTEIRFHHLHGPNIQLLEDGTRASWQLERSGGLVFSEEPLRPRDCVTVTCEGSGRVRVGCTTEDPLKFKAMVPDSVDYLRDYKVLTEIRFHKRSCSVRVFLNASGTSIACSCGDLKYDKVLQERRLVWVALYIMFGEVKITATKYDGSLMRFSSSHGINIDIGDDRTTPSTVCSSPGAFCAVGAPMRTGQNIYLRCQPTMTENQTATNFSLRVFASTESPEKVSHRRIRFSLTDLCANKPPMTPIVSLRKQDCYGEVRISYLSGHVIEYRTANNQVDSHPLPFEPRGDGIYVYLELYRVSVQISTLKSKHVLSGPITFMDDPPKCNRTMSNRSNASYCYNHVTLGSRNQSRYLMRSESLPRAHLSVNSDGYVDMGATTLTSSCPAELNTSIVNVDSVNSQKHCDVAEKDTQDISGDTNKSLNHRWLRHKNVSPDMMSTVTGNMNKEGVQNDINIVYDTTDGCMSELESLDSLTINCPKSTNINNTESVMTNNVTSAGIGETKGTTEPPAGEVDCPISSNTLSQLIELRQCIRRNWTELIHCIQTEAMGDLLFEHGVLSHPELDKVRRTLRIDSQEANRLILDTLFKRGIDKGLLVQILEKTCDGHLKQLFFKT